MLKNVIVIILAIISTIGLNINLDQNLNFMESLTGNDISYILIFFAFVFLIYRAFQSKDRRLCIISLILGLIFSLFEIIGHSIVNYGNMSGIFFNKITMLKNIIKFIYYVIIIYSLTIIIFKYLGNLKKEKSKKTYKFFTNNKRSIFIVSIILLLFWLPYFLAYYPGILGVDSFNQLEQVTGIRAMSSHHPIFLTLMLKLIINMTSIFNNMTISIAICILIKMTIMSFTISIAFYYLAKKNINLKIRGLLLVFFALNPVFPFYAISLDKDSLFACILLIDLILLVEFITNTDIFLKSKIKISISFICILLTAFVRNNGIYIFILIIPFIYFFLRKKYVKITIFFIISLLNIYLINSLIFVIFNVSKGSSVEMLSIPIQAWARLAKYNDNNLEDKEKEMMNLFMEYDKLADSYNPNLSDPEKGLFKEDYFKENKLQYISLNIKLFMHYPSYYIESILCNTSGYWYPENKKIIFDRGIIENQFDLKTTSLIPDSKIFEEIDTLPEKREIPVVRNVI